jgi:hypothetical protein
MTKETDGFYCKGKKVANLPEGSVSDYKTPEHKLEVTEKFNLGDKVTIGRFAPTNQSQFSYYKEEDVKEFIRRLKEDFCCCSEEDRGICYHCRVIGKLAGEKLK